MKYCISCFYNKQTKNNINTKGIHMNDIIKKKKSTNLKEQDYKSNKNVVEDEKNKKQIYEKNINELNKKILKIKKKIHDINIREQAEIENIKKNHQKKITEIKNIKLKNFFKDLIPIIDNFKKINKNVNETGIKDHNMIQGIPLILKSLLTITNKFGLKEEGSQGHVFNFLLHKTKQNTKILDSKKYYITDVLQHGYTLNNNIIRKALVEISNKKNNT